MNAKNIIFEEIQGIEAEIETAKVKALRQGRPLTESEVKWANEKMARIEHLEQAYALEEKLEARDPSRQSVHQPLKPIPGDMGGGYRPTTAPGRPFFKGEGDLGGFKSLGEIVHCAVNQRHDPRWNNLEIKAQTAGVFSEGGALVPDGHSPEFLRMILEASTFLKLFRTLPMENATLTVPGPDDANHSTSRAGINGAWTAEGDALTVQTIKTRAILLRANKFGILTKGTREYFQDALGGEAFIRDILAKEGAWSLDHCMISSGTGAGMPLSILNAPGLIQVNKEAAQEAGTFVWENAVNMFARLSPDAQGAFWVFSPSLKAQVLSMTVGIGTAARDFSPACSRQPIN
jgi:HK97 family phage major capsid protein